MREQRQQEQKQEEQHAGHLEQLELEEEEEQEEVEDEKEVERLQKENATLETRKQKREQELPAKKNIPKGRKGRKGRKGKEERKKERKEQAKRKKRAQRKALQSTSIIGCMQASLWRSCAISFLIACVVLFIAYAMLPDASSLYNTLLLDASFEGNTKQVSSLLERACFIESNTQLSCPSFDVNMANQYEDTPLSI